MTTRILGGILGLTLAAGVVAVGAANQKLVLVTVVANDGRPQTGLPASEFSVSEGKDAVEVMEAVPAREPLSIVLVADTAEGEGANTPELRRALTSFVATLQAGEPGAQIALYQVAQGPTQLTDFTSDRAALEKSISGIASGTQGPSAMLDAVVTASQRLSGRPAPRRAIVCVSIGTMEGSPLMPEAVGSQLRKSGATLWVVSVQGASDSSLTSRDMVWTRTTADSGGLRQNLVQASRVEPQLKTIAHSLLSQYTLKLGRKKDGDVKGFKGHTKAGSQVLFTRWMR